MNGPAQYAMQQEAQQKENFQNIIRLILAYKQQQYERELQEREWANRIQNQGVQNQFEERRTRAYEEATRPRPAKVEKPDLTPQEKLLWNLREYKGKKIIDKKLEPPKVEKPEKPEKPPKPTQWETTLAFAKEYYKNDPKGFAAWMLKMKGGETGEPGGVSLEDEAMGLMGGGQPTIPTYDELKKLRPGVTKKQYDQFVAEYKATYGIK